METNQQQPQSQKIPPSRLTGGAENREQTETTKSKKSNLLKRSGSGDHGTALSKQFYKRFVLDVLAAASAAGAGYFYFRFLEGELSIVWALLLALSFVLFAGLGSMLGGGWKGRLLAIALSSIALLLPFYSAPPWGILAPSAIALVVFSAWGDFALRRRQKNMLKFAFFPLARIKVGKLVTGLTIAAVILYLPFWQGDIPFLSQDRFGVWYERTTEFIRGPVVGDIELSGTVGEFAQSIARRELQKNPDFQALPPDVQDRFVREAARELLLNTENKWNIDLADDRPVSNVAHDYLLDKLADLKVQLGDSFLAVWGVVIFFLVRSVGTIFSWITVVVSYLFYEILVALGAVRLTGENAVKEFVEFT